DWIELHNPTANAIALNGWFLSDDPALPTKWALPAGTLAAGGYLVVFASEKDRTPAGAPAHTNFKLNRDGEFLALSGPNGVAQQFSPAFPVQAEDVSFGIIGGDPALAFSLARPTPGAANETSSPPPKPVQFSAPSGTFTGSLTVTLTTTTSGAQIFYTTNGAAPSPTTGALYTGPLAVTTTTRLRAVALHNGETSDLSGASYVRLAPDLLAYQSSLPLLVIENFGQGVIPQKGWTSTGAGVRQVPRQDAFWVAFERAGATATFADAPQMQGRIGIRGRGAYSTTWNQKPFSVESLDEAGAEKNVAPLGLPGHADWVLYYPDPDNDKDPTLLFNTFAYALSNACGRYAPRFRFVEVFVHEDGGDLSMADRRGVYALLEKVSRGSDRLDFQKLSPEGTAGTWLLNINRMDPVPETGWPAANGATQPQFFHTRGPNGLAQSQPNGPVAGDDLPQQSNGYLNFDNPNGYEISAPQRAAIESWFQQFESVLYNNAQWRNPTTGYRAWLDDRDFAEFFVFHTLTHNGDGLLISMFPWRGDDGRLRMGPVWDFNWSSYYISGVTTGDLFWRSNQLWYARLFTDPDFNQLFIDRWTAFRRGPMSNTALDALIDAQAAEITDGKAVQQGIPNAATWHSRLTQMKTWLRTRANWIDSQFVPAPQLSHPGGNVSADFNLAITANTGTVFYTLDGSDPRAAGGTVAAGAQSTSPLVLNGIVRLVARVKNGTAWSGLVQATFVAGAASANTANLAITEIHYHPAFASGVTNADDLEFVELQNIGLAPVSLLGVKFVRTGDSGIEFDFSSGSILMLPPGGRLVVVKNRAAFQTHYGNTIPIAGELIGNLSNAGDTLTLQDSAGAMLRSFTFRDSAPWPPGADGSGYSLVLAEPTADPAIASNWRTSADPGGNPGATDAIPLNGNLLEYVCGPGVPDLTFDRTRRLLSLRRRPGSDAVNLTPERSGDLQQWESGPAIFSFAAETRDAAGSAWQNWAVVASDNSGNVFFRVRIDTR
ncbi:MAG TPA: CotH kinase family protein, partial [Chthoniobacteraceae bacterium]|nr:CotH kinase family protein [Chthoniobacteraceae bacterium]